VETSFADKDPTITVFKYVPFITSSATYKTLKLYFASMKTANKAKTPTLYAWDISHNNVLPRHYKPPKDQTQLSLTNLRPSRQTKRVLATHPKPQFPPTKISLESCVSHLRTMNYQLRTRYPLFEIISTFQTQSNLIFWPFLLRKTELLWFLSVKSVLIRV